MNTIKVEADRFSVAINEDESVIGLSEGVACSDLKLTVTDEDGRVAVILGIDKEIESLVKEISSALSAKQGRERQLAHEDVLEGLHQCYAKKSFRLRGDVDRALRHLGVREDYTEIELEGGGYEVVVQLPGDTKTLDDLNWLKDAYCIEWKAEGEPDRVSWENHRSEGF